jgi:NADPH:quinone reductase-like Zn-dependent oxidoreductase
MRGLVTDSSAAGGLRLADDLPEPEPAGNELVLSVRAFSINAGEVSLIEQRPDGWRPGQDTSGVVLRAAADGSGPPAGARVVAYPEWQGWAERIVVPANWVAALPRTVSFEQAATLPVAGLTALRALRAGGAILGRDVLITGATGGVGQFAVQLAVASGARVTAQVSRPERRDDARQLGAHKAVVSLDETSAGPFHLVLDAVGGKQLIQVIRRLAPGASVVLYGNRGGGTDDFRLRDFYQAGAYNARVIAFISTVPEETKGEDLDILARLVAGNRLTPQIGWTGDWTQTAGAFAAMAQRAFPGKAVLTVPHEA